MYGHDAFDPRWHDAIPVRTSRRRYSGEPLPTEAVARLRAMASAFRPCPEIRVAIVENGPENIFTGWVGSYGRIEGAPMAALFVEPAGYGEAVGYTGEALVLEATLLGIGTCWVAGNFSRKRAAAHVDLRPHERVVCATPLGIALTRTPAGERMIREAVRGDRRKPLARIAPGYEGWPAWAQEAVHAARLAPSGSNRQPWHFRFEEGALVLSCPPTAYFTANIDRGIAMLHAELGARNAGVIGRWERLPAPGAVRFVPDASPGSEGVSTG